MSVQRPIIHHQSAGKEIRRNSVEMKATANVLVPGLARLLLILSVLCCSRLASANSLSKAVPSDHQHHRSGCEAIQRILNGTSGATHPMHLLHDKDDGFLMDHEQWHNHKDCEYRRAAIARLLISSRGRDIIKIAVTRVSDGIMANDAPRGRMKILAANLRGGR